MNLTIEENNIIAKLSAIEFIVFYKAIREYTEERVNGIDKEIANRMLEAIKDMTKDSKILADLIFKGVRNYKTLKDLADLIHLDIKINGKSVYDKIYENGIAEECVNFVCIDNFGWLEYIYFNYNKNGECVSSIYVGIENLEDEYIE